MSLSNSPFTLWLTGLSASGKTTLAKNIIQKLHNDDSFGNVLLVDGDEIREKIGFFKYNNTQREHIGNLKAELAEKENKNGKFVIVTGIAAKSKWRQQYRKIIKNYYEVYLKCSLDACTKRDYKNQYNKVKTGLIKNFVGVTDKYEEHKEVDLVIDTETNTIEDSANILLNFIKKIRK
tara:strand:- start:19 stop:552 length:534 start_codon:yes stop_codon:yes gene_type:complete